MNADWTTMTKGLDSGGSRSARQMQDGTGADGPIGVLRQVLLPCNMRGMLWLTGLPDTDTRVTGFLAATQAVGVSKVIILAEHDEIMMLAPSYAAAMVSSSMPFIIDRFPIRDFGVPRDSADFMECARRIATALCGGGRIVLHCRGGIGRTGMMAQAVLVALGMPPHAARLRVAHAGSHCETAEQIAFLQEVFANAQG